MELRFLPSSLAGASATQQHNNNCEPIGLDHRRTLERSIRHINQHGLPTVPHPPTYANGTLIIDNGMGSTGDIGITQQTDLTNRAPSLRRTPRRTTGSGIPVPNSPRFMRSGISNDMLQHSQRSPIPSRVAAAAAVAGKRNRLGRMNDNISSGSLNSIEV